MAATAGLIENAAPDLTVNPAAANNANDLTKGAGYNPAQIQLNPQTDTVEGRIAGLIQKNSAPMQLARTSGLTQAASRGLLNSSMAVGAAENAVYNYATPIATSDATNSLGVKQFNVGAQNTALSQGATGTQALQQIAAQTGGQSRLQQEQGIIQKELQAGAGDISSRLQSEKAAIDQQLLTASGQQAVDLQARKGEIDKQLATLGGDIQTRLLDRKGQIDLELQTASAADASRLQAEKATIDQQLMKTQIDADVAKIAQQGQIQSQLVAQQGEIEQQLQTADAANKERLLAQQGQLDYQLAVLKGDQTIGLTQLQGQINMALQTADAASKTALLAQQGEIDKQLTTLRADLAKELQVLQGTQAEDLARIDGTYKTLLQTSQSASVFYSQIAASIGEILANGDIKVDQKNALVAQQTALLENGLAVIGGVANLDLNGLLVPPTPQIYSPPATTTNRVR